jgi:hypothetical protein
MSFVVPYCNIIISVYLHVVSFRASDSRSRLSHLEGRQNLQL